ncbi:MAG: C1 family peptidase [Candidatus Zixiibacteriota bacterium]|nr:MAG: C1 family peptidase [candidate division Zixibacteria bacterium]
MKRPLFIITLIITLLSVFIPAFAYDSVQEEINAIQKEIDEQGLHWFPKINPIMTDYTPEERKVLTGLKLPENWEEIWRSHLKPGFAAKAAADLPSSFNWEDSGKITSVKNQGNCGSCWIFAAVASLEATYKIYRQLEYDLSEQQILSCVSQGWGCDGGWMNQAYEHFRDYGSIRETDMPYLANHDIPCTEDQYQVVAEIQDWTAIPNEINLLKTAVMTAPVAVAFTVYDNFNSYGGGCYSHPPGTEDINHAVLLVGWDDNMCEGQGAWRAKNSWGNYWGDNGYFWMQYGSCNFGVAAALLEIDYLIIVDPTTLPNGLIGEPYSHQMTAAGGTLPYHWSLLVAYLPHGLVIEEDGVIHGIPEREERYTFALRVLDSSVPQKSYFKYHYLTIGEEYPCCDFDGDESRTLVDILQTIAHLYQGGPPPDDIKMADCDCSHTCNLLDILALIDFLYGNGDPPCEY